MFESETGSFGNMNKTDLEFYREQKENVSIQQVFPHSRSPVSSWLFGFEIGRFEETRVYCIEMPNI